MNKYNFEDIKDQVVLVTGSGRGIGKATAELFAAYGAKVVITDLDVEVCNQTRDEIIKAGGQAMGIVVNVTKADEVEKMFNQIIEKWGKIDVLINNAGLTRDGLFLRMSQEQWNTVIDVNLNSAFLCSKEAVKHMRKTRSGSIINMSSVGRLGNPGQANYSAAKSALLGLTFTLAKELGSMGIRVNCVAPGFVETRMTAAIPEKIQSEMKNHIPLKRTAMPEELAYPILFLSSKMASYVSGAVLDVHGGGLM